jgi:isoquinoline 1-oxidoreductase subunit alpha
MRRTGGQRAVSHRSKCVSRHVVANGRQRVATLAGEGQDMAVQLVLNGKLVELDVEPDAPVLWAIREAAGLTGTKYGCGMALCGACTVHLDGRAIRSCVTPVRSALGKAIITIEGVSGPLAQAVFQSWENLDVPQCGYCQPGQIMSAIALLQQTPVPTDEQIDEAMSGNICRCGTYVRIRMAIHEAASTHSG